MMDYSQDVQQFTQLIQCSHPTNSKIGEFSTCLICHCTQLNQIAQEEYRSIVENEYKIILDLIQQYPNSLKSSNNTRALIDTTIKLLQVNSTELAIQLSSGTSFLCEKMIPRYKDYFMKKFASTFEDPSVINQSHVACLSTLLRNEYCCDLFICKFGSATLGHITNLIVEDPSEEMRIDMYNILGITCHTAIGYSMLEHKLDKILEDAFTILDKQESLPLCQKVVEFLKSILQQDYAICSAFTISEGRLFCMSLKRMIFHGNPVTQLQVMIILNILLERYNEHKYADPFATCDETTTQRVWALLRIPTILLNVEIVPVVSEIMNTPDPQLFNEILDFLEHLCLISSSIESTGQFVQILESSLRLGVLRICDENYSKPKLIRFYLILLGSLNEIPPTIQQQIITYYSSLPLLSNSPCQFIFSKMINYCTDPSLKSSKDLLVKNWIEYASRLEKRLNYKTSNTDCIGQAFKFANEIIQNDLYPDVQPERPIKLTLASMLPFLQHSIWDFSHLQFLNSSLRCDLKSSIILIEELTTDHKKLKTILLNFLFHIQALFPKIIDREQQDVLWVTLYELLSFVERREERQEVGSKDLLHSLILQPWMEQTLLCLIAYREPSTVQPRQAWRFTKNCVLFIQKWLDLIEKQLDQCPSFGNLKKMKNNQRPSWVANLCHVICNVFVREERIMKKDLTPEHQTILVTLKEKLMTVTERLGFYKPNYKLMLG